MRLRLLFASLLATLACGQSVTIIRASLSETVVHVGVKNARVEAAIDMPEMEGMPVVRATGEELGNGDYRLAAKLAHLGEFRLTLTINGMPAPPVQFRIGGAAKVVEAAMPSSGTSQEPRSAPMSMLHFRSAGWSFALHGVAFAVESQQSGERGRDKFFGTNWGMASASHKWGPGEFTARTMLSLDALTITQGRYPLLLATGETYKGLPIVNGQHPHDFFMELAASYQLKLPGRWSLQLYGGPRGDPALGPPAFPHRVSNSENPIAVSAHHLQDSTHISTNVATAGIGYGPVTWEVSGFHGREPDEKRWGIEGGTIDSLSSRVTVNPSKRWTGQFSLGRINNREALHPDQDSLRLSASVEYVRPLRSGHWASTFVWGRNDDLPYTERPGTTPLPFARHIVSVPTRVSRESYSSYLGESTAKLGENWIWARYEAADKNTSLLYREELITLFIAEQPAGRAHIVTGGYGREISFGPEWLSTSLGGQFTLFHVPPLLQPVLGTNTVAGQVFLRFRLRRS